jgi:hypothetical protein
MNKILIATIIAGIVIPITVYAASPLFINTTIDEPLPANVVMKDEKMIEEKMTEKMIEEETIAEKHDASETSMTEKEMMEEKMMEKESMMEEKPMMEKEVMMEEKMMEKETTDVMEETQGNTQPLSTLGGKFIGVGDGIHDAQGKALVLPLEGGQSILRLEEFRSTNGPDLYVYLATDSSASDYVSLGRLKANIGNQNYDIPSGTDLSKYDNVLIWCKQFSVLFGSAELS